jgi:hypothetical protein
MELGSAESRTVAARRQQRSVEAWNRRMRHILVSGVLKDWAAG